MLMFLAFRNLFRNVRRTVAILLTIALGAGALFAIQAFNEGVLGQYREGIIHSHYGHGQINTAGYRDRVHEKPWERWMTNSKELEAFVLQKTPAKQVFPRVTFSALLSKGSTNISGVGQGIRGEAESKFFHSLNIEEGAPLETSQKGILLGRGLARSLDVHPGEEIEVLVQSTDGVMRKGKFEVAGIFHTGNQDFDNRIFRLPLEEAKLLLRTTSIETLSIGLEKLEDWEEVARKVQRQFPDTEAVSFAVLDEVFYQHSVDWMNVQFAVVQCIILFIVLLGIFNTTATTMFERKQEFGNLRANGESMMEVMHLMLWEGAFIGLFGSLLGVALTFSFIKGVFPNGILMPPGPGLTKEFYAQFAFNGWMALKTAILTAMTSFVATLLAGIRVARMPIAEALRSF